MKSTIALAAWLFLLAGCGQKPAATNTEGGGPDVAATPVGDPEVSIYAAAIASDKRPEADRVSDASRQPASVLAFFGIQPGDVVLEMWAGGGYYTELLAHVVGENGKVYAHANTPILNFAGDAHVNRHAGNRLPNTVILMAENNELSLQENTFDAITIILNYHDLYWSSEQYGWEQIDVPAFIAEIYKGLKPGGILGIVDHQAESGAPAETGNTLHRIDSAIVVADLEAGGFVLDGESDVLRNAADDLGKSVFDPAVRGKTDRFVLRFVKPE